MKLNIKNWLLNSFLLIICNLNAQNLVKNPSFENYINNNCYWGGGTGTNFGFVDWKSTIGDTSIINCFYYTINACDTNKYPYSITTGFQYAHSGNGYTGEPIYSSYDTIISSIHYSTIDGNRNKLFSKLKDTLTVGQSYCAGLWWVSFSTTSLATDDLSLFINHGEIDTVDTCDAAIPWVVAQVNNPTGNIMNDTTNWNLLQGSFDAKGGENTITIGSFKAFNQINVLHRGLNYRYKYDAAYLYDDVFLYPLYLPAFAGNDTIIFPGDSITLGRVGEQLVCTWFDTTGAVIGQGSSIKVAPMVPTKYIIMQDLCNIQKFDTVLVIADSILAGYDHIQQRNEFKMYPNPAKDEVTIDCNFQVFILWNLPIYKTLKKFVGN